MKILYDSQCFTMQNAGGLSRYFASLINLVPQYDPDIETDVAMLYSRNKYLDRKFPLQNVLGNILFGSAIKRYIRMNHNYSLGEIRKRDYTLFHPTYYNPEFLYYKKDMPFVLTVHDMTHELLPQHFSDSALTSMRKRTLCQKAAGIITISETTKNDLVRLFKIDENKVHVIYLGNMIPKRVSINNIMPLYNSYILYIGDRMSSYKNFIPFVKSIAPILSKESVNLVCVGTIPFTKTECELFYDLKINNLCHYIDATEEEIISLYRNAICMVYPSLYEGFGVSITEAFTYQCPVLCSNTGAFPEIGGEAPLYFDPNDMSNMKDALNYFLKYGDSHEMIDKGEKQLEKFTLKDTIQKTIKVYKQFDK